MERNEIARQEWREIAETRPARRVVVIDESATHLDMIPKYARAPRGERAYATQRRNYGKNVTLRAGLTLDGMTAPLVIEGAVNTAVFEAYVEQVLCPSLPDKALVILDKLAPHHAKRIEILLRAKGAQLLFLPAYSPDFSPIEQAFSKMKLPAASSGVSWSIYSLSCAASGEVCPRRGIKQALRPHQAQTLDALIDAIALTLQHITPFDAIGFFVQAGLFKLD